MEPIVAPQRPISSDRRSGEEHREQGVGIVGDEMRMDPHAVAAVGHRLGSTGDALREAIADTGDTRFGPDAVGATFRDHGVAYAAGMRDVRQVIAAMAASVAGLADGLGAAAVALTVTDTAVAEDISTAGGL